MERIQRIRVGRGRDRQAVERIQRIRAGRVSTAKQAFGFARAYTSKKKSSEAATTAKQLFWE